MRKYIYETYNWTDIDKSDKNLFEQIELDLLPLIKLSKQLNEAELSDSQIQKMFLNAERLSKEDQLRTNFGKAVNLPNDTLIKVNSILSKFGKRLQESKPVQGFDAKFDQLKANFRSKMSSSKYGPQILAMIDVLGNDARQHPIWQAAIVGILTTISGLMLGPGAIPIMATVLKGVVELLKGEKLSTAIGKGVYAGSLGFLSASVASGLFHWFEGLRIASITPVGPKDLGFENITFNAKQVSYANGMQWTKWFNFADVTVDHQTRSSINQAILRLANGDLSAYDTLVSIAQKVSAPDYLAGLKNQLASATITKISNDGFLNSIKELGHFITAAAGGAGAYAASKNESYKIQKDLLEGLWSDLTLQFGAGKLLKAWKAIGSPTDSVDVARLLADMGMTPKDIKYLLSKTSLTQEEIDQTLADLHSSKEEVPVPFKSGITSYDAEADKIFRKSGIDGFVKYWEQKVIEIEKQLSSSSKTDSETVSTNDSDEPIRSDDPIAKESLASLEIELKNKNIDGVTAIIQKLHKITPIFKTKLLQMITTSDLTVDQKHALSNMVRNAVVTDLKEFIQFSKMLKEHQITWKQLGYRLVINEKDNKRVIIL